MVKFWQRFINIRKNLNAGNNRAVESKTLHTRRGFQYKTGGKDIILFNFQIYCSLNCAASQWVSQRDQHDTWSFNPGNKRLRNRELQQRSEGHCGSWTVSTRCPGDDPVRAVRAMLDLLNSQKNNDRKNMWCSNLHKSWVTKFKI